jgi:hypothetical protein
VDEQASFEPRAVLAPRRAGRNGLAVIVPALALVAVAWAGLSGARSSDHATAPDGVAIAAPSVDALALSPAVALPQGPPRYPAQVIGINVEGLDVAKARALGRDTPVAIAGWYVPTAVFDCPPLAAIYRPTSLADIRDHADSWAYCERSGVLYASQPGVEDQRPPTNNLEDNRSKDAGLPAVAVTVAISVVMPPELEVVGSDATPVVVVGRFVESNRGCGSPAVCRRELVVDHLAWAFGID